MKKILEKRALLFAFLVLILAVAGNTAFNLRSFRKELRTGAFLRCRELAENLKGEIEKDLEGGNSLAKLTFINSRCRRIVREDPNIAYCLVEDARGTPLYCSDPSFVSITGARRLSIVNASTTLLHVPALGDVFDVSAPIFSSGHRLVGRIRFGVPNSAFEIPLTKLALRSLALLGFVFLFLFALIVLFTKRWVLHPIRQLREDAGAGYGRSRPISSGDGPLPERSGPEDRRKLP
jgi:hypothetical protein